MKKKRISYFISKYSNNDETSKNKTSLIIFERARKK
jgi:hypothetical protein